MITFTDIRKFLATLVFNPAKEGPMKVIVEVGDPNYYLTRAMEMLQESKREGLLVEEREVMRTRAIQLIVLNVLNQRGTDRKPKPKKELCGAESAMEGVTCSREKGHSGPHRSKGGWIDPPLQPTPPKSTTSSPKKD